MRRTLLADTVSLAGGSGVMLVSGAALNVLSARWLGPRGKGELVLAFAVASLLAPVAAAGVDSFIAARGGSLDGHERAGVIRFGLGCACLGGMALALATGVYGIAYGLDWALIGFAAFAAALRPVVAVLQAAWVGADRVARVGRVLLIMSAVQLAAALAFGAVNPSPTGFAAAAVVSAATGVAFLGVTRFARSRTAVDGVTRRRVLRFGGTVVASDALQLANYRIDLFFLAALGTLPQVGVYVVAVSLAEILWQVPYAVGRSLLPRVHAGEVDRRHLVHLARVLAPVIAGLGAVGLAATSVLAVPVLGDGFSQVPGLLALLLPGVVTLGAVKPMAAWVQSQGRPGRNLVASGLGFLVVVVGDVALIPSHGPAGAAIASTLSYCVTAGAVVVLSARMAPPAGDAPPVARSGAARPASNDLASTTVHP